MAHPNVVINGITYNAVPEVDIPKSGGGTAKFYDVTNTTVAASDILNGKIAVGSSGEITGSMANNGAVSGNITTKNGTVTVPAGYTTGGSIGIASAAVSDLQPQYVLSGKTILGVAGTLSMVSVSQDSSTKVLTIA